SESLDVDALESYADPVTATPYAVDEFSSSEALSESFPAVDATSLSSDSAIKPLLVEYDAATMPKCLLPSDVERD
ncbi:hypothetical protein A2U01_0102205, partial [Trifolium medium]|nr:hypothetical protein [Trifolium medium]